MVNVSVSGLLQVCDRVCGSGECVCAAYLQGPQSPENYLGHPRWGLTETPLQTEHRNTHISLFVVWFLTLVWFSNASWVSFRGRSLCGVVKITDLPWGKTRQRASWHSCRNSNPGTEQPPSRCCSLFPHVNKHSYLCNNISTSMHASVITCKQPCIAL